MSMRVFVGVAAMSLLVAGMACKRKEQAQATVPGPAGAPAPALVRPATATVANRSVVLAEVRSDAPAAGGGATSPEFVFAELGGGVAWVTESNGAATVVHNGRAGRPYGTIAAVVLSRDGRRCAFTAVADGLWRVVVDGKDGPTFTDVRRPVFSPDGAHLAYVANAGGSWHLVVDGTLRPAVPFSPLLHEFGADSSTIVFIDGSAEPGWGKLVVSDLAFERERVVEPRASSPVLNAARSRAAAIAEANGRQRVVTFALDRPDAATRGPEWDAVGVLAFGADGVSPAYLAERAGKRFVVLGERHEPLPPGELAGGGHGGSVVVAPGGAVAGALMASDAGVAFKEFFGAGRPSEPVREEAETLVYASDGQSHVYAARQGERSFVVANGQEGPAFDRVVSPMFSSDGKYLVYRARKDGKRFVVVADAAGKTLRQHPAYEQVFPSSSRRTASRSPTG